MPIDIKFNPAMTAAGLDPSTVDKLIEIQKAPLEKTKKQKEQKITEKQEVNKLKSLLSEMKDSLEGLKNRYSFYKLKVDSSHPDIIDGIANSNALVGNYELEVRALARAEKELAYGFPDKIDTPVGFGYMLIELENGIEVDVDIEPYTTLQELATQINDMEAGVRAMVVNTKYKPDPYRLLVISEKSGKEAKVFIDEDTSFLEFKEQVTGRNLDALFEDVPITDEDNILDELIDGVNLTARRSEPGTRVNVNIVHDIEATIESIKGFVDKYNSIASFVNNQFQENPETGEYGILSADATLKYIMRQLQSSLVSIPKGGEIYSSLIDIGIKTNSETGLLDIDENKVKEALSKDYHSVAKIFIETSDNLGIAPVLMQRLKNIHDPQFGALTTRLRGLDTVIKSQDKEIEQQERRLETREKSIRNKFNRLESTLTQLQGQSDFLKDAFKTKSKNK